jgi:hypothetical protein
MSAKALTSYSFDPAAGQTVATDHQGPEEIAAEIQFRKDLWREYQIEAINAGFSTAQATAYAGALSLETSPLVGVPERAPISRGWFYQSRARVVRRTFTSGLIRSAHWVKSKATGRAGAACASVFARGFRWWNEGEKR